MKKSSTIIFILVFAALISGCAKSSYVGKSYAPTVNVDLFMDENGLTRPYEVMGQVSIDGESLVSTDKLQEKMMEEAKARGADAVLIEGYEEIYTGSSTSTNASSSTDKKGNQQYHGNSYTSQTKRKILKAKLLKYTD
jgi:hypothetical protein